MSIREQLAKNLAFYRNRAGLTQQAAADILGTKKSTLSSWERCASQPNADMLVSIAFTYKASLSDLCGTDYKMEFTSEEKEIIYAFRQSDELEKAIVRKIIGIREKKDSPVQKEA